jgi:hypothetical protein
MGAARLEVVAGKAVGMSILVDDELLIGRHAEGAGRLADDEEISRSHACVSTDSRGLFAIEDLGSTNGTFVNGIRISAPQTLSEGDTIEMGATTLVVREVPQPDSGAPVASETPQPTRSAGIVRALDAEPPPPVAAEPPPPVAAVPSAEDLLPPTEAVPPPAPPAEAEVLGIPPLAMQLEVDFDAREARLFLDQASEPVRLVFEAGTWRAVASPLIEKGPPHERRPDDA